MFIAQITKASLRRRHRSCFGRPNTRPYVHIQLPEDARIFSETCPKMEMLLFWMIGDLAK